MPLQHADSSSYLHAQMSLHTASCPLQFLYSRIDSSTLQRSVTSTESSRPCCGYPLEPVLCRLLMLETVDPVHKRWSLYPPHAPLKGLKANLCYTPHTAITFEYRLKTVGAPALPVLVVLDLDFSPPHATHQSSYERIAHVSCPSQFPGFVAYGLQM